MLKLPDKTEWRAFIFLKDNVNQCPKKKLYKRWYSYYNRITYESLDK